MGNGFAVGQGCGFLFQWVTGCCLGLYSRWVAVVICWWATGCCGGSPTVSADLQSPSIFFFFIFVWFFLLGDLWVWLHSEKCFHGGFVGLLWWWVCGFSNGGLRWIAVVGLLFLKFFFFILRCSKHCKIFSDYFPKYKQTLEKQSVSLKLFTFTNILRWRMFYIETNGA